jgi:hypothetical protein
VFPDLWVGSAQGRAPLEVLFIGVRRLDEMRDLVTHGFLRKLCSALVFTTAVGMVAACHKSQEQTKTAELRPVPPVSSATPSQPIVPLLSATPTPTKENLPPPQPDEVRQAMSRIFEQSARMDDSHTPAFLTGDFNGDGSQDLAVITKPAEESLAEINNELANWVLEDPREIPLAGTNPPGGTRKPKPTKAEKNDQLLTIIHGVGPQGWRNSEARQTYLLRNAVGANVTVENAEKLNESLLKSSRPLHGDVISETINGRRGLICWTGAKYAWQPQR